MKPLYVLLFAFAVSVALHLALRKGPEWQRSARIAFAGMLLFTALGHFLYPRGMAMMIPPTLPGRLFLVYASGLLEIALAAALLVAHFRRYAGWALLAFLALALPFNIYAALHHVSYEKADFSGPGPAYLWLRIPLQLFFMAGVWFAALKKQSRTGR